MIKVLKFSASWCASCKVFSEKFDEIKNSEEFKNINFESYDVEDNPEIATKYKIRSVPTTIILKNNIIITKIIGNNYEKLIKVLTRLL